jgi:hypothetical protein
LYDWYERFFAWSVSALPTTLTILGLEIASLGKIGQRKNTSRLISIPQTTKTHPHHTLETSLSFHPLTKKRTNNNNNNNKYNNAYTG